MTILHFNYSFGGKSYPCTYRVRFDHLIVAAKFGSETISFLHNEDPLRLARVTAHDILSKAGTDGLL